MIELPEAKVLARQLKDAVSGKRIASVEAAHTQHKFAWYNGDPQEYGKLLAGDVIVSAEPCGGMVELKATGNNILFSDGVNLRCLDTGAARPDRHQFLMEFSDGTAIYGIVQMYGGISLFQDENYDNKYYRMAMDKPSPYSTSFDEIYYESLFDLESEKLSVKAFLATEQRIPGLGNGVLQDILYCAGIHPKRKIDSLSADEKAALFGEIKAVLSKMESSGGRDTEKDLYGNMGGYKTRLSKNTVGAACPVCDGVIKKSSYLGGSIYYCERCQPL